MVGGIPEATAHGADDQPLGFEDRRLDVDNIKSAKEGTECDAGEKRCRDPLFNKTLAVAWREVRLVKHRLSCKYENPALGSSTV